MGELSLDFVSLLFFELEVLERGILCYAEKLYSSIAVLMNDFCITISEQSPHLAPVEILSTKMYFFCFTELDSHHYH